MALDETALLPFPAQQRTGAIAETFPRLLVSSLAVANTTGQGRATLIGLIPDRTVRSITFLSGSTAAGVPIHCWYELLDSAGKVVAVTADALTAAWAANTEKTLALTSPYTPTSFGPFYAAKVVAATTMPTSAGFGGQVTPMSLAPMLGATFGSGLTAPPTVGTVRALTASQNADYAWVS